MKSNMNFKTTFPSFKNSATSNPFSKIDSVVNTFRERYKKQEEELQNYVEYKKIGILIYQLSSDCN